MSGWTRAFLVGAMLVASGCGDDAGSDTDDNVEGEDAYPSTFTTGKYRVDGLALAPSEVGEDHDDDGEVDNNLPSALSSVGAALPALGLSAEGFDAQIATDLESGALIVLFGAQYATGELSLDVLGGLDDGGTLTVDPASLGPDGAPLTRLRGGFDDQVTFAVGPQPALLAVPFLPDAPPSLVPLDDARVTGTMGPEGVEAVLTGLIPAERLADDVLIDLIPDEGFGSLTKEQLVGTVRSFANLPGIADVETADGRAVSCAFTVRAAPATWAE